VKALGEKYEYDRCPRFYGVHSFAAFAWLQANLGYSTRVLILLLQDAGLFLFMVTAKTTP